MNCPVGGDAAVQAADPVLPNVVPPPADAMADPVAAPEGSGDYWRDEVASRLERYRARRKPRAPRYPSLRLPFDAADSWVPLSQSALAVSAAAAAPEVATAAPMEQLAPHLVEPVSAAVELEPYTNLIEFPRSAVVPLHYGNELAEPVLDRPRIVEAPEVLPPPPALGGILMEPAAPREPERRHAAEIASPVASLGQRLLAGLFDVVVILGALAGFAAMFVWVNPDRPPLAVILTAAGTVAVVLWTAYRFLFIVSTGSTPGLLVNRLKLVRFDGTAPSRRLRRWRVLASYMSALALGLGYLWSILDEDGLCWHDRITRTHIS